MILFKSVISKIIMEINKKNTKNFQDCAHAKRLVNKLYNGLVYYIIDDGLVLICGRSRHKCMSLCSLLGHKKINDASRHINLTMRFKFKNCWLDDDVQEDLESRALQLPLGQSIIVVESFMSAKDCKTSKSPV